MTHIKHFTTILSNFYLGLLEVPLGSLGKSMPVAASHPLPAEIGTLFVLAWFLFPLGKPSSEVKKEEATAEGVETGQVELSLLSSGAEVRESQP